MENQDNKTSETVNSEPAAGSESHEPHGHHGYHGFFKRHECEGKNCHCHGYHHGRWALRFILRLIIALIILCIGISIGRHAVSRFGNEGFNYRSSQMMGGQRQGRTLVQGNNRNGGQGNMMWSLYNQTGAQPNLQSGGQGIIQPGATSLIQANSQVNGQTVTNFAQIAGQITQINGWQVIVGDATGNAVTITVSPNTVIVSGNKQISFASLKSGQNIIAAGTVDQNQNLVAQVISLQ